MVHVEVTVRDLALGPATSLAMVSSCLSEGVARALRQAWVQLLEPCSQLEVTVPEDYVGQVLADLSSTRRAQIQEVGLQDCQGTLGKERVVNALAPLAGLMVSFGLFQICNVEPRHSEKETSCSGILNDKKIKIR